MANEWGGKIAYSPQGKRRVVRQTPKTSSGPPLWRRLVRPVLIVLLLTTAAWWLFDSSTFRIQTVRVTGAHQVSAAEIRQVAQNATAGGWLIFRHDSLWLYPSRQVKNELQEKYPSLTKISIERDPLHTITVKVGESEAGLVWRSGNAAYLVGKSGQVLSLLPVSGAGVPVPEVSDTVAVPVTIGQAIVTPQFVDFATQIRSGFQAAAGSPLASMQVGDSTLELEAHAQDGTRVLFDTTRPAVAQLKYLKEVTVKVVAAHQSLDYVDLRIDGKVFYKTK